MYDKENAGGRRAGGTDAGQAASRPPSTGADGSESAVADQNITIRAPPTPTDPRRANGRRLNPRTKADGGTRSFKGQGTVFEPASIQEQSGTRTVTEQAKSPSSNKAGLNNNFRHGPSNQTSLRTARSESWAASEQRGLGVMDKLGQK